MTISLQQWQGNQDEQQENIQLGGGFELASTGLVVVGQPSYGEWEYIGGLLRRAEQGIQFALGDWLNYGEQAYGEKYAQALEETDYAYGTLVKLAYITNRIEMFRRRNDLSFNHHAEVAHLLPDEQDRWLERAAAGDGHKRWSVAELRKKMRTENKRQLTARAPDAPENNILHGDSDLLFDLLPDGSVDMFFTDPPYHEDKTNTFAALAELAAAKLRPGGLCLTYSGQMHLPQVIAAMSTHLSYWWMFALRHSGGHLTVWNRNLWNDWKPILVFARPYADGTLPLAPEWVQDFIDGGGRDKQYHEWGQDADEATYWIEKLTEPDALVCDPYVGGGAIPAACKLTGRRWVGTEIDSDQAQIARGRLDDTPAK